MCQGQDLKPQMLGKSSAAATSSRNQEVLTEYPWDDEDSLDQLDEAAIRGHSVDDKNHFGAPNSQAALYSESANNAALKFGIQLTTK
jgi:hypothetical protein